VVHAFVTPKGVFVRLQQEGKVMFNTILVPTDGSSLSANAIRAAIEFALVNHSKIVAISVAEPLSYTAFADGVSFIPNSADYERHIRELAQSHVQKIVDAATVAHVPCETHIALSFSPSDEILKASDAFECDVIFMATHGRKGLNKLFVGSQTQRVLAHSTIPVMVFH
jgi:nucleotide-binding universal stress UspA family protein